jgi:hypothetical protein
MPYDLQRSDSVDLPAGVYGERPDTAPGPQPEADELAIEHQRACGARVIFWLLTGGDQRAVRDTDSRQIEYGTEVEGQPGPTRVVPPGRVHKKDVRRLGQAAYGHLEDLAIPQGQQARLVGRASGPDRQVMPAAAASPDQRGRRPRWIAGAASTDVTPGEADEAPSDQRVASGRRPVPSRRCCQLPLDLDEVVATSRPEPHRSRVPHQSSPGDVGSQLDRVLPVPT